MDKELKDFLDSKFNKIDQRSDKVDSIFDKMNQRFDKIDQKFDKIDQTLEVIRSDVNVNKTNILVGFREARQERFVIEKRINDTYNAVDGFVKNIDDLQDEFIVIKEDSKRVKIVLREKLGVDMA